MPERIPQSATIRVPIKAYLSSDHVSPATGKTIAITISKNGAAYANPSAGATNATEISNGSYYVDLSTTDTGTLGPLFILGTSTGVDNVDTIYDVVKATNAGLSALPDTAATTNGSLITQGTGTAQINTSGTGKVPVTLASTDVTGNVATDLQTIKTQTVTCAAGVTVGAFVGNATAELSVDASGRVDLGKILGTASAGAAGYVGVDWAHINAPTTTVNLSGTTINTTQQVDVNTIKTQTVTCAAGVTFGPFVGNATAAIVVDASGFVTTTTVTSPVLHSGTAQAGGNQTITLAAGASSTNNIYGGCVIKIYAGTGAGQTRVCQNYNGTTKVQNVDNNWTVNPDNTSQYAILAYHSPATDGGQNVLIGSTQTFNNTGTWTGNLTGSVGSVTGAVGSVTGNVGGNVVGSVASVTGAVGSVTGNVGGNVVGSVGSISGVTFPPNLGIFSIDTNGLVSTTSNIKKNTALNKFEFLMTDSTNHAPATGLTVAVTRSIDGAAFGAGTLSAVTEVGNGIYYVNFAAADLNGNVVTLRATATGADDTLERIVTQP